MTAHEFSGLTGVSVRTLHHYDQLGLLCPKRNVENNYREYRQDDVNTLQQILFFKACGFSLKTILQILQSPGFDRMEALQMQKKFLSHEKRRIDKMLHTLDMSILELRGEINMSTAEKFSGFDFSQNPYEAEARQRWGNDAVDSSQKYMETLSEKDKEALGEEMNSIFRSLAAVRTQRTDSETVQSEVARLHAYLNNNVGYHYSPQAFAGLGLMYKQDERFQKNIDAFGEGLADFLSEAMALYAEKLAQE